LKLLSDSNLEVQKVRYKQQSNRHDYFNR